ncbi:hypothetical protein WJX72_009023 [[Myrmecia] bisecta]|uniref:Uncharacterized protein n=1 Tax=[Myrmecia] bisecta TaxID=41462 RepID=A0AAW1P3P9_9CHLO
MGLLGCFKSSLKPDTEAPTPQQAAGGATPAANVSAPPKYSVPPAELERMLQPRTLYHDRLWVVPNNDPVALGNGILSYTFVILNHKKEALLVDVVFDFALKNVRKLVQEHGWTVKGMILTHNFNLEVSHFPGHTEGHVMIYLKDHGGVVITGDCAVGSTLPQEEKGIESITRPPPKFNFNDELLRTNWANFDTPIQGFAAYHGQIFRDRRDLPQLLKKDLIKPAT